MKKILTAWVGICLVMPVLADDAAPGVKSRTTDCPAIRAEMDGLTKITDPDAETTARLDKLRAVYRADCGVTGNAARRGSGRAPASADKDSADVVPDESPVVTETVAVDVIESEPLETAEEAAARIAANIAAGLCSDGAKPNKYGCCDGERFTDMGNLVFKCCPREGGDCVNPRHK